jgi:LCP family protein required for cell wall assembly
MKKIIIVFLVVGIIFTGMLGFLFGIASRFAIFEIFFSLAPTPPLMQEANILVLGVDNTRGHLSDTIMLLHINPEKKSASLVSIPRDTIAELPQRGLDKINAAYAYGGIDYACKTAENFLQISIPYYITVNLSGIQKLIDEIGGITIDVEKRMYYVDYAGGLFIDLKPGRQKLSGKQLMGYLRFRHSDGDFARINRQQNFLKAVAGELMKRENLIKSPALFFSLLSNVDTNLNSREILGLSMNLRAALETGQVYMTTIPGTDLMLDGIYYWKPDREAVSRIVEQYITGKKLASSG